MSLIILIILYCLHLGLAVGEEKFMSDASEVMDLLLKTHTEGEQLPADDPQTSYLISAWSRICRIMGKIHSRKPFHVNKLEALTMCML